MTTPTTASPSAAAFTHGPSWSDIYNFVLNEHDVITNPAQVTMVVQAALERFGTVKPNLIANGMPLARDLDAANRCWWGWVETDDVEMEYIFTSIANINMFSDEFKPTYWLPHWALPPLPASSVIPAKVATEES